MPSIITIIITTIFFYIRFLLLPPFFPPLSSLCSAPRPCPPSSFLLPSSPTNQPADEPTSQPASQPAGQPASQPANEPKPAEQPASQPTPTSQPWRLRAAPCLGNMCKRPRQQNHKFANSIGKMCIRALTTSATHYGNAGRQPNSSQ